MVLRNHHELTQRLHKQRERLVNSALLREAYLLAAHRNQYLSEQDKLYSKWNRYRPGLAGIFSSTRMTPAFRQRAAVALLRDHKRFFESHDKNIGAVNRLPAGVM